MKTTETDVLVIKETPNSLYVTIQGINQFRYITPRHMEQEGKFNKEQNKEEKENIKFGWTMHEPVRIAKKHLLEGSDNLGIPDNPTDITVKRQGKAILPVWRAKQIGI